MTETTLTATTPTVFSNSQAAGLAVRTERNRVLAILALADPPISESVLDAIARGVPTARANRALIPGDKLPATELADDKEPPTGKRPWKGVIGRMNERQRAKREALT